MYEKNGCVYQHELPKSYQYMRNWNKGYLQWARAHGMTRYAEPITIHLYSEVLQKFRLAAQGKRAGRQPPDHLRKRIETHFDPLPFYSETLLSQLSDTQDYPLNALTQRPMGDVSLVGLPQRLVAADSYAQLPLRQPQISQE